MSIKGKHFVRPYLDVVSDSQGLKLYLKRLDHVLIITRKKHFYAYT